MSAAACHRQSPVRTLQSRREPPGHTPPSIHGNFIPLVPACVGGALRLSSVYAEHGWQSAPGLRRRRLLTGTLARFSRDSNIFRTNTTEGTCPMQYLLPYTRVEGAPIRAEPSWHPVGDSTWRPCMQWSQPRMAVHVTEAIRGRLCRALAFQDSCLPVQSASPRRRPWLKHLVYP